MVLPKVNVIMPTYNSVKCLIEAIECVLNQSYQDFKIIVVDDGSTDNTNGGHAPTRISDW
jgi:glycosyltransferase involved in cell wall biosynthesis